MESWDQLEKFGQSAMNRDCRLGERAVAKGWITAAQLQECLQEQEQNRAIPVGAILVRKRYLSSEQLAELLREGSASRAETAMFCPACRIRYRLRGTLPAQTVRCPRCGGILVRELSDQTVVGPEGGSPPVFGSVPPEVKEASGDPGRRFGKFVKVAKLGEGGMGSVWKCWDLELARWVAVKFVEGQSEAVVARVLREAQAAARLQHPSIVQVYEVGRFEQLNAIIMQYVNGPTLHDRRPPLRETLAIMADVAEAVGFAHRHGIIHRDLKPGNILLGENGRPYVTDFGIAKYVEEQGLQTTAGRIMGTPGYMAPEQARGDPVDARADVYSLGATLYELVTGRPPHQGAGIMAVLDQILNHEPPSPRKLNAEIPSEVETIILKAMDKQRERRYQTAQEFADDLRRYLSGEPIRARRPSVTYRLRKKIAKHRWVVLAFAAAVLMGSGFAVYVAAVRSARLAEKRKAVDEAERHERERRWTEALAAYSRAYALDPADERVAARRALMKERVDAEFFYERSGRELHSLRLRSYREDWKLTGPELEAFERLIELCERQLKRTGDSGNGCWVVARARHLLGDWDGALQYYERGLRADPGHPMCLLFKARLHIENALFQKLGRKLPEELVESDLRAAEKHLQAAFGLLQDETAAASVPMIERDLMEGYRRVIERKDHLAYCDAKLQQWKGTDFWEEFYVVRSFFRPEAVEDLTRAIEHRRAFYEAYFWRGLTYYVRREYDRAVKDFDRAIEINPRFGDAYHGRGLVRLAREEYREALKDLDEVLKIDPANVDAYNDRGGVYGALGDLAAAIRDYDKALELKPDYAFAYCNRAKARFLSGQLDKAEHDCEQAIRIAPGFYGGYMGRARVREARGDLTGALEDFNRMIQCARDPIEGYHSRGHVYEKMGRLDEALSDFNETLRRKSDYGKVYCDRAGVYLHMNRFENAIRDADQGLALEPRHVAGYVTRAVAQLRLGRLEEALRDADTAVRLDPGQEAAYTARGNVHLAKGNVDAAIQDFTEVIRLQPNLAAGYCNRGAARFAKGDLEGAIEDYAKALDLQPRLAEAWYNRGLARQTKGDLEGALQDYSKALEINARYAQAHVMRASIYMAKGQLELALQGYDSAIQLKPDYSDAYFNRGVVRQAKGDLDGALRDYDKTIQLRPEDAPAHVNRATVKFARGDFDGALEDTDRALRLNLALPEAYATRGLIRRELSVREAARAKEHLEGAVEDFRNALRVAPPGWPSRARVEQELERVRRQLEELGREF